VIFIRVALNDRKTLTFKKELQQDYKGIDNSSLLEIYHEYTWLNVGFYNLDCVSLTKSSVSYRLVGS
jgi:hypothetical protein